MEDIRKASSLNQEGVTLLCSNSSAKGISSLQSALRIVKTLAGHCENRRTAEVGKYLHAPNDVAESARAPSAWPISVNGNTVPLAFLQNGSSYIYDRTLCFESTGTTTTRRRDSVPDARAADSSQDEPDLGTMDSVLAMSSAVLLFNLAQAYHQLGRLGKESAMKKALVLYRMCNSLVQNSRRSSTASNPTVSGKVQAIATEEIHAMVVELVALNNSAQIYHEQCDHAQSRTCIKKMSTILTQLKKARHDDGNTLTLTQMLSAGDIEGLYLNVMLLQPPHVAHAA